MNMGAYELGIRCSIQKCLKLASNSGFEGIDVDMFEAKELLHEKGANYVKDLFANYEMNMGGWIWFNAWGFSDDEKQFEEHLGKLPSLAQAAEKVGASRAMAWILPYSDELNFEQNFERHVSRIEQAASILEDHGQQLAIEYVGPKTMRKDHTHEFIWNLDGALSLLEAVNAANVGLLLDSWHWYTTRGTMQDIKSLSGEQIVYVHIADAPANTPIDEQIDTIRRMPGSTGLIDNAGFLKALHSIGYHGPVTAEPFSQEINELPAEVAAKQTAEAISKLWREANLT